MFVKPLKVLVDIMITDFDDKNLITTCFGICSFQNDLLYGGPIVLVQLQYLHCRIYDWAAEVSDPIFT